MQCFTKGYSTKGAKRGLGLPEVERIVDDTKNMSLETAIKNMAITQKIIISKEG